MRAIIIVLFFSICAFGMSDPCGETSNLEKVSVSTTGSLDPIITAIKNSNISKTLMVEVKTGNYSGDNGIVIERDNVCLYGTGKPVIKRTKFSNEANEPSVIKIYGASNVTVKGFNLEGTIDPDNREVGPIGVSVVNFTGKEISHIYIEDNFIYSIGQYYDYGNENGFWRYPEESSDDNKNSCKKSKKKPSVLKVSCGQAHGIHVASNQNLVSHVYIRKNTLSNLRLGKSEAITVGERVYDFEVSGNIISDVDNIGIDIAGRQGSTFQSAKGTVSDNRISGLKGQVELGGQNKAYPFVAGIYIDGGTGISWDEKILVSNNTVTGFGIGISVGSENDFCNDNQQLCNDDYCVKNPTKCKKKKCLIGDICNYTQVQFIELSDNILRDNQVYGIGIGKDSSEQNSQTWNIKVISNTIVNNVLTTANDQLRYSQLHFGSLESNSLSNIEVRNNKIAALKENTLLVAVKPSKGDRYATPPVSFYSNTFYSVMTTRPIWSWGSSAKTLKDYYRNDLVETGKDAFKLPLPVIGENNIWKIIN